MAKMNIDNIYSQAEKNAQKALSLDLFRGFDLSYAKDTLANMLSHIGRNGLFSEYTKHDISHVDGMLQLLNFIIVEDASKTMTPSDWMMIVLGVYFHDLGMIITEDEYENRMNDDNFIEYLNGLDKKYYEPLKNENRDKAIYQDYVREHHGDRVFNWISSINDSYNGSNPIEKLLYDILSKVDSKFRIDLARLCKSHQEKILDVFKNEDADIQYSQDENTKVNLIYCAAVLRTADLLHVTSERTPNVDFLLISPRNAYSRREWVKQRAVNCILPKQERDKDDNVDPNIEAHLFEVRAEFNDDDAYLHFNKYLDYAQKELSETNKICRDSSKRNNDKYSFPWDGIDKSKIKTINFSAEKLRFELDKDNILKLLIGHTLYSNASVVLRELTQNAIDAVRLMTTGTKESSKVYEPKVFISWDSNKRELTVADNGVGMNEKVIRNYLFRVGVSNYHSEEFKKEHPNFHSISRFGIGILTCFMVSDEINITTCHHKENRVHLVKIRHLEGEYILRHDGPSSSIIEDKHGTTFCLKLRDDVTVKEEDIERHLRNWIIIPRCKVTLSLDGRTISIGYKDIDDAMSTSLEKLGINIKDNLYHLAKYEQDGRSFRVLMKKNTYLGNSSFYEDSIISSDENAPIGCCVEGIKVIDDTPGFDNRGIIAMIDCVGWNSPSTNVARDRLEEGEGGHHLSDMYRFIYDSYLSKCIEEGKNSKFTESSFSTVRRASLSIDKLWQNHSTVELANADLFNEMLRKCPCIYVDDGENCNISDLDNLPDEIWTENSQIYSSAVNLAAELSSSNISPQKVIESIKNEKILKKKTIYADYHFRNHVDDLFLEMYQVDKIELASIGKSISMHWKRDSDNWYMIKIPNSRFYYASRMFLQKKSSQVEFPQDGDFNVYVTNIGYFISNTTPIAEYLECLLNRKEEFSQRLVSLLSSQVETCIYNNGFDDDDFNRFFSKDTYYSRDMLEKVNKGAFKKALENTVFKKVDFGFLY